VRLKFAVLQAGPCALSVQNAPMEIYIYRAAGTFGPYDEFLVRRYIAEGQLSIDDLAWREGLSEWVSLKE
jgi:uncharacterized protein DUF4339